MITFDSFTFPSGSTLVLGPLVSRLAEHVPAIGSGSTVTPRGRAARVLTVTGVLVADTADALDDRRVALEALIDSSPATFTADRTFEPVVVTSVAFRDPRRIGPRHACGFRVDFQHLRP